MFKEQSGAYLDSPYTKTTLLTTSAFLETDAGQPMDAGHLAELDVSGNLWTSRSKVIWNQDVQYYLKWEVEYDFIS